MATEKTILVTGGAGFLGSHLSEALLTRGDTVIALDNLLTGARENIDHLRSNERFTFARHDIIEPIILEQKIDRIYNLACPASPIHYQKNAIRTIKANTIGVINVLGLAKARGARILQASTSEIYGDPDVHPQTEEYRGNVNTIGPRACYDEGKRVAETLLSDYHRSHGLAIRIARIFNTYGPRMAFDDGRVVSNFILQALRNEPMTIYGDGKATRSFCYVDDLVRGLIALMESDYDKPVNIGNPNEITVSELAEKIKSLTNSQSEIVYKALPEDDPHRRKPDITRAQKELGWEPHISLLEGLVLTIENFKHRLN